MQAKFFFYNILKGSFKKTDIIMSATVVEAPEEIASTPIPLEPLPRIGSGGPVITGKHSIHNHDHDQINGNSTSTSNIINNNDDDDDDDVDNNNGSTVPDSAFNPSHPDAIVQASRLLDSEVPDGGYGWVVLFALSIIAFWFVGTPYCWGVLQAALVKEKVSSPSTLSFVGSLTPASISFLALVNSRLIKKIGARNAALLGVGLMGLGEVVSGFATKSVGGLFVCTGVIMGAGVR